jgi:hypothetical protein
LVAWGEVERSSFLLGCISLCIDSSFSSILLDDMEHKMHYGAFQLFVPWGSIFLEDIERGRIQLVMTGY